MAQSEAASGPHKHTTSPSASSVMGRHEEGRSRLWPQLRALSVKLCRTHLSANSLSSPEGPSRSHPNSGIRTTNFLPENSGFPTEVRDSKTELSAPNTHRNEFVSSETLYILHIWIYLICIYKLYEFKDNILKIVQYNGKTWVMDSDRLDSRRRSISLDKH